MSRAHSNGASHGLGVQAARGPECPRAGVGVVAGAEQSEIPEPGWQGRAPSAVPATDPIPMGSPEHRLGLGRGAPPAGLPRGPQ